MRQIIATHRASIVIVVVVTLFMANPAVALDFATVLDATHGLTRHAWTITYQWTVENYNRNPAFMVGLAAVVLLPPLALASGLIARLTLPRPAARSAYRELSEAAILAAPLATPSMTAADRTAADHPANMAWPREAWITFDHQPGLRRAMPRELLSIGRGEDNDLVLDEATVHRYHALIQRTPDALFLIKDLGGAGGNGVVVNDERVIEAHLLDADRITLGAVTFVFHARRIGSSQDGGIINHAT
jgi:FHA domain